ncbi:hypothetical protein D0876_14920 [Klebsiella pneumoniae]|nr:hypothetical protein D0876_14920 [Klebsiella pneumoniae]
MIFIKLFQIITLKLQSKYGWELETVFDPIFHAAEDIVSMTPNGILTLKMSSGEHFDGKETAEEIIDLINCHPSDGKISFWSNLGKSS